VKTLLLVLVASLIAVSAQAHPSCKVKHRKKCSPETCQPAVQETTKTDEYADFKSRFDLGVGVGQQWGDVTVSNAQTPCSTCRSTSPPKKDPGFIAGRLVYHIVPHVSVEGEVSRVLLDGADVRTRLGLWVNF
jgi:hypothetical protein